MNASKTASARSLGSDLAKVDAHRIGASEYDELPELTDDMMLPPYSRPRPIRNKAPGPSMTPGAPVRPVGA